MYINLFSAFFLAACSMPIRVLPDLFIVELSFVPFVYCKVYHSSTYLQPKSSTKSVRRQVRKLQNPRNCCSNQDFGCVLRNFVRIDPRWITIVYVSRAFKHWKDSGICIQSMLERQIYLAIELHTPFQIFSAFTCQPMICLAILCNDKRSTK